MFIIRQQLFNKKISLECYSQVLADIFSDIIINKDVKN